MLENKNILAGAKAMKLEAFSPEVQRLALGTSFYANSLVGRDSQAAIYNIAGAASERKEDKEYVA